MVVLIIGISRNGVRTSFGHRTGTAFNFSIRGIREKTIVLTFRTQFNTVNSVGRIISTCEKTRCKFE